MNHPDEKELRRYNANDVSRAERREIVRHLAICPECLKETQSETYLRENIDQAQVSFNISSMESDYRVEYLRGALKNAIAETQDESLKAKLQQWLATLGQQTGLVFQTFQNKVAKLTMITKLKAPGEYMFQPLPYDFTSGLVPTLADEIQAEIKDLSDDADQKLKDGDFSGVEDLLRQIVTLEPTVYRKYRIDIIKDYLRIGFIESDSAQQRIAVYLYADFPEAGEAVAALLPPAQEKEISRIKSLILTQVAEKEYYLAVFENLPGRVYEVELRFF